MATSFTRWRRLVGLVLWKNYLLKARAWKSTLVEIVMPTLIFVLLVIIRHQVPLEQKDAASTAPLAFPSSGTVVFLQSLLCHGLSDVAGDVGVEILAPSLLRQVFASVHESGSADIGLAAATVTSIMAAAVNSSAPEPIPNCVAGVLDSMYTQMPLTINQTVAAGECYCQVTQEVNFVQAVQNATNDILEEFIAFPGADEVRAFLEQRFHVEVTDEEVANLDATVAAILPLLLQKPFSAILSGDITDPMEIANLLLCPQVPSYVTEEVLDRPEYEDTSQDGSVGQLVGTFASKKIYYAPKNPKTDAIIKQMNRTFELAGVGTKMATCTAYAVADQLRENSTSLSRQGMVLERWFGVDTKQISALVSDPRYPYNPDIRTVVHSDEFSLPENVADRFGQVLRGAFLAPATGTYTFWLTGDDETALHLGYPDGTEERICHCPDATGNARNWYFAPPSESRPIHLKEGVFYELKLINKEDGGLDFGAIAVQVPSTCTNPAIPLCGDPRFKRRPVTGEGVLPTKGVVFMPNPLYYHLADGSDAAPVPVTNAYIKPDIGALTHLEITDPFVGYDDPDDMVRDAMPERKIASVLGGIEFLNLGGAAQSPTSSTHPGDFAEDLPEKLEYSIRFNPTLLPSTKDQVRKITSTYGYMTWFLYYYSGFSFIQDMVDRAFINLQVKRDTTLQLPTLAQQYPTPNYISDDFAQALGPVLPLFMTISMVYIVSITVKSIVYEKELKLKETLKLMGVSSSVHWTAWLITCIVVTLPSMIIIAVLMFMGGILQHSNPFLIFLLLEAFVISSIFLSFLISSFFSQAKIAAACAGLIFCGFYVPFVEVILHLDEFTRPLKLAVSLMSTTAFGLTTQYISDMEQTGNGLQWSNLFRGYGPCDNFSAGSAIIMVLLDGALYMALTLYFEAVLPGQYGVPKHPLYFLGGLRSLPARILASLRPKPRHEYHQLQPLALDSSVDSDAIERGLGHRQASLISDRSEFDIDSGDDASDPERRAEEEAAFNASCQRDGVVIENLVKDYQDQQFFSGCKKSKPLAVNGLSINIPPCQVTSLLGSNGAGKSTTISILCGLFPATSGRITICGKELTADNVRSVREHIGVCPQHNTLFDKLTVQEHITLAANIKKQSFPQRQSSVEADFLLKQLGLVDYLHVQSMNLSGGNKRKLSVALAFLESPDVVILDEPTAGMDPSARRATWNLILALRKKCAVILTTHHLDEADLLSDKVVIMKRGSLRAYGTPLQLKESRGRGYVLTCSLDEAANVAAIKRLVFDTIPDAKLDHTSSTEISVVLPSRHVDLFPTLFEEIESNSKDLGVQTFGVSASKLEDVFLQVTKDKNDIDFGVTEENGESRGVSIYHELQRLQQQHQRSSTANSTYRDGDSDDSDGDERVDQQRPLRHRKQRRQHEKVTVGAWHKAFTAQLYKRYKYTTRDIKTLISVTILPVVFLSFAMLVAKYRGNLENLPRLEVGVDVFQDVCFGSENYSPYYATGGSGFAGTATFDAALACPADSPSCPYGTTFIDVASIEEFTHCFQPDASHPQHQQPVPLQSHHTGDGFCFTNNLTNYLVRNSREFTGKYHGALTFDKQEDPEATGFSFGQGVEEEELQGAFVRGWFSPLDLHSLPSYMNLANNAALKVLTGNTRAHITTYNHPLNTSMDSNIKEYIESGTSVSVAVFILFALSFVPASVLVFTVLERVSRAKHLQLAAGSSRTVYWLSTLAWDYACYVLTSTLCLIVLVTFDIEGYAGRNLSAIFTLILLFGFACIPLMYPLSFLFQVPATAFVNMIVINMFVGITTTLITFILDALDGNPQLAHTNTILKTVFLVLPNYCLGRGILNVVENEFLTKLQDVLAGLYGEDSGNFPSPFSWDIAGKPLMFLCVQAFAFPLITLAIEHWSDIKRVFSSKLLSCSTMRAATIGSHPRQNALSIQADEHSQQAMMARGATAAAPPNSEREQGTLARASRSQRLSSKQRALIALRKKTTQSLKPLSGVLDVAALRMERDAVLREPEQFVLRVAELTKVYRKGRLKAKATLAVDRVSFGVQEGECFGMLGVNGAGKTTTFKTITGQHSPSFGDVFVGDISVRHQRMLAQRSTGYCPQFDALLPRLTPQEHLFVFSVFRNLPSKTRDQVIGLLIKMLGLEGWKDTPAQELSGGNKRKLSLALALIGNRQMVLLDEPSAGMDAHAKRFLWSRVVDVVDAGASVLLTSHSMEECEALCTRVAIMVKGRLQCIGTPQFLKSKYGDGYTLVLKCAPDAVDAVLGFVQASFEGTGLVESHRGYCRFIIPTEVALPLSRTFRVLLEMKLLHGVEHFTISQTSLEDVFLKFSSPSLEEDAPPSSASTNRRLGSAALPPPLSSNSTPPVMMMAHERRNIDQPAHDPASRTLFEDHMAFERQEGTDMHDGDGVRDLVDFAEAAHSANFHVNQAFSPTNPFATTLATTLATTTTMNASEDDDGDVVELL